MSKPRLKEEEMTEKQKKRQIYMFRYREKKKKAEIEKGVKKKKPPVIKTNKSLSLLNERNTIKNNERIDEKLIEKKETAGAKILAFPAYEQRENSKSEREISLIKEVDFLKQELAKINEKLNEKPAEKDSRRRWRDVLGEVISPDFVLSAGSIFLYGGIALFAAAVCGYASVKLSAPFFGVGNEGVLSAASAEALAGLFAIFAALATGNVSKWASRLFGIGIVAVVTAFCFDGILSKVGNEAKNSSESYGVLTKEIATSEDTIARVSAQIGSLPPDWVSKRAVLEAKIESERGKITALSSKRESLPVEQASSWKVLGHFSIRLGLCVALMVLCEMLVGLVRRRGFSVLDRMQKV